MERGVCQGLTIPKAKVNLLICGHFRRISDIDIVISQSILGKARTTLYYEMLTKMSFQVMSIILKSIMSYGYLTGTIDCMKYRLDLGCAGCLEDQKGLDFMSSKGKKI